MAQSCMLFRTIAVHSISTTAAIHQTSHIQPMLEHAHMWCESTSSQHMCAYTSNHGVHQVQTAGEDDKQHQCGMHIANSQPQPTAVQGISILEGHELTKQCKQHRVWQLSKCQEQTWYNLVQLSLRPGAHATIVTYCQHIAPKQSKQH